MPVVVIACRVLQDMLERFLPEGLARQITFMDYGLHRVPSKLTWTLQDVIDSIEEPSLIVLGYGLCGNGLKGLRAGVHTLLVPRTDDCIAILLGSYKAYMREFQNVPGTYYLTKGWLESGSNPLQEYHECSARYGPEEAQWIMDQQYQHYARLVLVAQQQADLEKYRGQAQEVARYCVRWGMRYEEILGSDDYVRRLVEMAVALANGRAQQADDSINAGSPGAPGLQASVPQPAHRLDADFVVIPPGGEIRQELFMR
jgi:hypothetical protein